MRKLLSILVVIATLFTCCAALAEGEGSKYSLAVITRGTNVNLRKKPGGDIIAKIPRGTCVYIADAQMKGDKLWYQIIASLKNDHANYIGWMDASYLTDVFDIYTNVAEADAGSRHVLLRMEDGGAAAFGFEYYGNLDIGGWGPVQSIAAGRFDSFGLSEDGRTLYVHAKKWTDNGQPIRKIIANGEQDGIDIIDSNGILTAGYGYDYYDRAFITSHAKEIKFDRLVIDSDANSYISAYITDDHVLHVTVRYDFANQAKNADNKHDVLDVCLGGWTVFSLMMDGTLHVNGEMEQVYRDRIASWTDVTGIAAGKGFVAAVMADGRVRFAGTMPTFNWNYAYAKNPPVTDLEAEGLLAEWTDVVSIAASDHILVGVTEDGRIRCIAMYEYAQ